MRDVWLLEGGENTGVLGAFFFRGLWRLCCQKLWIEAVIVYSRHCILLRHTSFLSKDVFLLKSLNHVFESHINGVVALFMVTTGREQGCKVKKNRV